MFFSRILMLDPDNICKRVAKVHIIQAVYGNMEKKQGPVKDPGSPGKIFWHGHPFLLHIHLTYIQTIHA